MQYIYTITNKANGMIYVGRTKNPKQRFKHHLRALEQGEHSASLLQLDYNRYGKSVFDFEVKQEVENHSASEVEFAWMLALKTYCGYNKDDRRFKTTDGENTAVVEKIKDGQSAFDEKRETSLTDILIENIRVYCKNNGLNNSSFEKMCDLPNGTINGWAKKGKDVRVMTLKRIVDKTGLDFYYWLNEFTEDDAKRQIEEDFEAAKKDGLERIMLGLHDLFAAYMYEQSKKS